MTTTRRRGEQLETAILEAAMEILTTEGYEQLTFQNVAKKAKTSRTIIYGRYSSKVDLLHALVRYQSQSLHGGGSLIDLIEDRGSLRADLLAMLAQYHQFQEMAGAVLTHAILFELSQGQEQFRGLFDRAYRGNIEGMQKIQEFARRRGEIRHKFTDMQMSLPFDLLRFEKIVRGGAVTETYLTRLVDEVLLPIFRSPPGAEANES